MRIVFIGATSQVVESARSWLENGHEVVIVEGEEERLNALEAMDLDCGLVHGDGSRPAVLSELGPANTDFLFCIRALGVVGRSADGRPRGGCA